MFSLKYLSLLFLGCTVFSACNSGKGKTKGDLDTNSKLFPSKSDPNKVAPYDLDKNGKTDLTAFYDERGHLLRLERDINENGKKEKVIFYRFHPQYGESRKVLEQYDENEDGYLDGEKVYDGDQIVSAWFDTDYNRKPDVWQSTDKYGKVLTKIDSDGDGIPDTGGDHIVEGNNKLDKKQFNDAYEEYKMALNFNSRSAMAYWGMALALEYMHNYEMAIKHLERYILLKGPNKDQATIKINYLKNQLKTDFRSNK
jgi:tetratricopeptide (TPR) repeat protein